MLDLSLPEKFNPFIGLGMNLKNEKYTFLVLIVTKDSEKSGLEDVLRRLNYGK